MLRAYAGIGNQIMSNNISTEVIFLIQVIVIVNLWKTIIKKRDNGIWHLLTQRKVYCAGFIPAYDVYLYNA